MDADEHKSGLKFNNNNLNKSAYICVYLRKKSSETCVKSRKLRHIRKVGISIPTEICYGDAGIAVGRFGIFENA
jgi:hypothetical protein